MDMNQLAAAAGRPGQRLIADEFFVYSTGRLAALAPAATANPLIAIQADSDFLIEKTTFSCDLAGVAQLTSTQVLPNVTVLMVATSSGRQLMNIQLPISGIFGTGQLPFIWPRSYLLPASATLALTLFSFEAAVSPEITLNFVGRKLYWSK